MRCVASFPYNIKDAFTSAIIFRQSQVRTQRIFSPPKPAHTRTHAYLMREVDDKPYAFVRVVQGIYRTGGTPHEAVDEDKVAAHARLPDSGNEDTAVMLGEDGGSGRTLGYNAFVEGSYGG